MFNVKFPWSESNMVNLDWIINEIKKLHSDWSDFRVVNLIRFYGIWHIDRGYPAWSLVSLENIGYISTQIVPAGVDITNEDYWKPVADYSALLADMQERITKIENRLGDIIIVDKSGKGDYDSIMTAINDYNVLGANVTILVMSGVYNEELVFISKCASLSIIGVGAVTVEYASIYPRSPLFASGNLSIENVKFKALGGSGYSYALHVEAQQDGYNIPSYMKFRNCVFESEQNHGVGAGLGSNYTLEFFDCTMTTFAANKNAMYLHNFPANAQDQVMRAYNCLFVSSGISVEIHDDSEINFIGNNSYMTISLPHCEAFNPNIRFIIERVGGEPTIYNNFVDNSHIALEKSSTQTLAGYDVNILSYMKRLSGYAAGLAYDHCFVPISDNIYEVISAHVEVAGVSKPATYDYYSNGIMLRAEGVSSSNNNNKYIVSLKLKNNISERYNN